MQLPNHLPEANQKRGNSTNSNKKNKNRTLGQANHYLAAKPAKSLYKLVLLGVIRTKERRRKARKQASKKKVSHRELTRDKKEKHTKV